MLNKESYEGGDTMGKAVSLVLSPGGADGMGGAVGKEDSYGKLGADGVDITEE